MEYRKERKACFAVHRKEREGQILRQFIINSLRYLTISPALLCVLCDVAAGDPRCPITEALAKVIFAILPKIPPVRQSLTYGAT
jgi:hypothetical protein